MEDKEYRKRRNLSQKKYRDNNKEKLAKKKRLATIKNPEKEKNKLLKRFYGINLEQYQKMMIEQNNKCKICGNSETKISHFSGKIQHLSVDHCHETGRIRGLLCQACNQGLGHFKDNITLFEKAINYLKKLTNKYNKYIININGRG